MIFSGDKFGHPWHGAWNSATGKITAPDATEISLPGADPEESGLVQKHLLTTDIITAGPKRMGECYLFSALSAAPSESAGGPGETWLNYALLSGAKRRVYGVNLGPHSWLYLADDGTIWRANITTWNFNKPTSGDCTIQPVVVLRRFGVFSGAGEADVEQTINMAQIALPEGGVLTNIDLVAANFYIAAEDITSDGRRAMFCVQTDVVMAHDVRIRVMGIVFELQLNGIPPSATAAVELIYGHDSGLEYDQATISESYGTPVFYLDEEYYPDAWYRPTHDFEGWQSCIFGARYKADGTPEPIRILVNETRHQTGVFSMTFNPPLGYTESASGTSSSSGTVQFQHGTTTFCSFTFSSSSSYATAAIFEGGGIVDSSGSLTYSVTVDGSSFSRTVDHAPVLVEDFPVIGDNALCPVVYANLGHFGLTFRAPTAIGVTGHDVDYIWHSPHRYSNAVWGLLMERGTVADTMRYLATYGKIGVSSTVTDIAGADPAPLYCSEHPVSGEILRGADPLTWV